MAIQMRKNPMRRRTSWPDISRSQASRIYVDRRLRRSHRGCQYLISLIVGLWVWLMPGLIAQAAPAADVGASVFTTQCAACHAAGGNIIRRGKNLKLKALSRNHVDSLETIKQLVIEGKGNMSAYGDRLSEGEIDAVSAYVLAQAQAGWPQN